MLLSVVGIFLSRVHLQYGQLATCWWPQIPAHVYDRLQAAQGAEEKQPAAAAPLAGQVSQPALPAAGNGGAPAEKAAARRQLPQQQQQQQKLQQWHGEQGEPARHPLQPTP